MIDSTQYFTKKLVFFAVLWHTFRLKLKNWKKNYPKNLLIFMEKELFTCNIRKRHETETLKKIPDISLYALLSKQFLYLLKGKPFLYFYKRKLFSYFRKQNLVLTKPKPKKQKKLHQKKVLCSPGNGTF